MGIGISQRQEHGWMKSAGERYSKTQDGKPGLIFVKPHVQWPGRLRIWKWVHGVTANNVCGNPGTWLNQP